MHDYTSQTGGVQVSASLSGDQTAWGGMLGQIIAPCSRPRHRPQQPLPDSEAECSLMPSSIITSRRPTGFSFTERRKQKQKQITLGHREAGID